MFVMGFDAVPAIRMDVCNIEDDDDDGTKDHIL